VSFGLVPVLGAEDWEDMGVRFHDDVGVHWAATVPNTADRVVSVELRADGWVAHFTEGDRDFPDAPPLPATPFKTVDEARCAVDAWCAKWAPRAVRGLHGVFLRRRNDGKIGICVGPFGVDDHVLLASDARDLARALSEMADEAEAAMVGAVP
jgi:hypothetical protein